MPRITRRNASPSLGLPRTRPVRADDGPGRRGGRKTGGTPLSGAVPVFALLLLLPGVMESANGGGTQGPSSGGSFGNGGATSGGQALSALYPHGDGSLHWSIPINGTPKTAEDAQPIIPADHD